MIANEYAGSSNGIAAATAAAAGTNRLISLRSSVPPHLGHAPDAKLFGEAEHAAALRNLRGDHQHHEDRADRWKQKAEKEKTECQRKPHFAVDRADARDEPALTE